MTETNAVAGQRTTSGVAAPDESAVTGRELRRALGRFVTGVTVVTTTTVPGAGDVHGMTANSFTSVSLRPPLVLVSIATSAKMDGQIWSTGRYGVSVLSRDQEALSLHFAGLSRRAESVEFVWRGGVPLVGGALAHLTCSVLDSHPAGDHTLHVGQVDSVWYREGDPLVFYTGAFRALELVGQDTPWGF